MSSSIASIRILPAQLANQIAAGEVVERPASVVKELVENSLDCGATHIEIEIDKGGHKRIYIRDNGCGIEHQQLALALSRHATSKIASLDDLEQISSLGFRGEALASISSVARLTLTSKPDAQQQAWQAHTEGRDMQVQLNPVAHPKGTSVEVLDLFFNTPARRKFLRAEKTEFAHIDEVIRRIALSRFDVGFSLKHNGKLLRKYPVTDKKEAQIKRLAAICNKTFAEQAIALDSSYQDLTLKGWLSPPDTAGTQAQCQYFYVNGRVMRDKLINHAIRQAFEGVVSADSHPNYVLYLQIKPQQVDVNVHPAKHEVRFHQARLVHDFIFRALGDAINQYFESHESQPGTVELAHPTPKHNYIQPLQTTSAAGYSSPSVAENTYGRVQESGNHKGITGDYRGGQSIKAKAVQGYQQLVTPTSDSAAFTLGSPAQCLTLDDRHILVTQAGKFYVLMSRDLHCEKLHQLFAIQVPVSQPLLMPISIDAPKEMLQQAQVLYQPLLDNSVEIGWSAKRVILRKVPAGMRQLPWATILPELLQDSLSARGDMRAHLFECIASQSLDFSAQQAQTLWAELVNDEPTAAAQLVSKFGKELPLQKWIADYV
ncbi:MAG: DNA mismatch repair protein MutL [Paraglaciecola sp.]